MAEESGNNNKRTGRRRKPVIERTGAALLIYNLGRMMGALVLLALLLLLFSVLQVLLAYVKVRNSIELVTDVDELPQGGVASCLYARDYDPATGQGTLLKSLSTEDRQQVDYSDIPPQLLACVLSTEDARFFHHRGVDLKGLARAGLNIMMRRGEIRGGGSTITQQLSRNVFLPYIKSEKTLNRKMQEMILAFSLEKRFSKQEILAAYCNHTFFGAHAYGIKSAARIFFDKDLDELTLAECALIAGLPQRPTKLNPYTYADSAKARRNEVLGLLGSRLDGDFLAQLAKDDPEMFSDLSITAEQVEQALKEPMQLSRPEVASQGRASYFTSYVEEVLGDRYELSQNKQQGLTVVTTLDPLYQEWAEQILKEKIDANRKSRRVSQGAIIVVEAATGEVLVCVGGYGWLTETNKGPDMYNRAMLGGRPVGSSFKPFTYATAYEQGFKPSMLIFDGPNKQETARIGKSWPTNSDMRYLGWISMFYGLQMSRNAATVDLMVNCTGIEPVIGTARKMGITTQLQAVPALTLGFCDIKPVEMAEAFDTFVNMGRHVDSVTIKRVYDQNGILNEVDDTPDAIAGRTNIAFSENTAWMMVQNMMRVVEAGTGTKARLRDCLLTPGEGKVSIQVGGKTGTNDNFADAWFVGYTPELTCAVWIGNDDYGEEMNRVFGGDLPAQIWHALMYKIYNCQYATSGEGEGATKTCTYEPRYKQRTFEKPAGATFSGFGSATTGSGLETGEEGAEQEAGAKGQAGQDGNPPAGDDSGFYEPWEPPVENDVYY